MRLKPSFLADVHGLLDVCILEKCYHGDRVQEKPA